MESHESALEAVEAWLDAGGDYAVLEAAMQRGNGASSENKGRQWELELTKQCVLRGMAVEDISSLRLRHDLCLDRIVRVQCKSLGDGNCNIAPSRRSREGRRQYHSDDFDVMAVRTSRGMYFVPAEAMVEEGGWLCKTFSKRFEEWKDRWDVLEIDITNLS